MTPVRPIFFFFFFFVMSSRRSGSGRVQRPSFMVVIAVGCRNALTDLERLVEARRLAAETLVQIHPSPPCLASRATPSRPGNAWLIGRVQRGHATFRRSSNRAWAGRVCVPCGATR